MRVMIVGATGLVGQGALAACVAAEDVERIALLGRRRADVDDPRIEQFQATDLRQAQAAHAIFRGLDACLYCAGVVPGLSEADYRDVTVDVTLHVARAFAAANPSGTFIYVSGAGADAGSVIMPLRVKGEAEDALRDLPVRTVMVRPGIVQPIDGVRSPHDLRATAYLLVAPMLGLGQRFAPNVFTTSTCVGRAMLVAARSPTLNTVLDNAAINRLGA